MAQVDIAWSERIIMARHYASRQPLSAMSDGGLLSPFTGRKPALSVAQTQAEPSNSDGMPRFLDAQDGLLGLYKVSIFAQRRLVPWAALNVRPGSLLRRDKLNGAAFIGSATRLVAAVGLERVELRCRK